MGKALTTTLTLGSLLMLLVLACACGGSGSGTGRDFIGRANLTVSVYAPDDIKAYKPYAYMAVIKDSDGEVVSGVTNPHFEYELKGSGSESEVDAHEIGSSGVYAVGEAGKSETHSLTLVTPGEYHLHFRFTHNMFEHEKDIHVEVEADHTDVESGGEEYRVSFWLEEDGSATGHAHEDEEQDIVFQINDDDTGAAITDLTPLVYVAEQGGAEAVLGTEYLPVGDAEGKYVSSHTWSEAGEWDITIDLDGDENTHGDRVTWTQTVAHED